MKRLSLIRHGPTHSKAMIGWSDLPADLSDTAALLRLSDAVPADAAIISSDLNRAISTADAIAADRPRLPHDKNLREIHFGVWEKRTFAEIEAETPDHIRAYWETPGDIAAPGGESWNQLRQRSNKAIDQALAQHGNVIVVAHFGMILTQIQRAKSISTVDVFAQKIDNLSLTQIEIEGDDWTLTQVNHRP